MFYRCKDCGGNAVYDPKKKKMVCESCGNEETQEKIPQEKLHICNNCGAEIESKMEHIFPEGIPDLKSNKNL